MSFGLGFGAPRLRPLGPSGDPLYGQVRALFHLDNNLTDNSTTGTVATSSNLAYSDVVVKSGFEFSGNFTDASNDAVVTLPTASALSVGTSDFCVEFWYYPTSLTAGIYFLAADGANLDLYFLTGAGNTLSVYIIGNARNDIGSLTINTWHHLAITRASGTCRTFINGTLVDNFAAGANDMGANAQWTLGSWAAGAGANKGGRCYIDDFRLTVGAGRYTSAFTPPAAPFPNF